MNANKTIYQVDSFTDKPFTGNPAGVMLLEKEMPKSLMQNIAMEMNLSETAFIVPDGEEFKIRFFTPTQEIPLCGHATLASAHILFETGTVDLNKVIRFKTTETVLKVAKKEDWIVMDFPEYPVEKTELKGNFKEIAGFQPIETYSSHGWKIAVAGTENEIRNASPDSALLKANDLESLIITAKSDLKEHDFVLRCFVPEMGIPEDPVTGSAHCALTPLWAERLGKKEMRSLQVSQRTGVLRVALKDGYVEIKGKAVTIFKAELNI